MISFLHPLYLVLLPLATLPILLNLIKRRVRLRLAFPSVQLLKIIEARRARRRPKWQEILLLAVRVAVITAFVVALADPRLTPGGASPPRALIMVVDNSPSMAYVDGEESRLARAARFARKLAAAGNEEDRAVIVWTGSKARGLRWEDSAASEVTAPPAAAGGLAEAWAETSALWRRPAVKGRRPELAVFTDMQRTAFEGLAGLAPRLPAEVRVTFFDVRSEVGPPWNVALTGFRATPKGDGFIVNLDVRQYGRPRPLVVEDVEHAVAADVPAASRANVRFALPGGRRYDFFCRGGYPGDDSVAVALPATAEVSYDVAAGTARRDLWEAAWAAAGDGAVSGEGMGPPGVFVMPASERLFRDFGRARAEAGGVVVLVPGGSEGGGVDGEAALEPWESGPSPVTAEAAILPTAATAGVFKTAGVMPLKTSEPWAVAAATAEGWPFIAYHTLGKGEVFLLCAPAGREFSDFFTSAAFVGFALDLKSRALARAYPDFVPARSFASAESDPEAISESEVRRLFPHAVVTSHEPLSPTAATVPLQSAAAAAVLLLLAAEAILASAGRPPKGA